LASRRQARQYALQALYEADLKSVPVGAALNDLWAGLMDGDGLEDERPPASQEVEFAQRLVFGVREHQEQIDSLIEECSINWRLPRMPVVDRNVLRLAAFELLKCADIPPTVSINEAIELAKLFGTAESRAFVNGIVDRMGRKVKRIDGGQRRKR
jgi:N utilization substance protein B